MIGGRVLDASAVVAFAEQTSVYTAAVVWTATEADVVLLVPATVIAAVGAVLTPESHEVLDVLLSLPVTVLDPLDAGRARAVGGLVAVHGMGLGAAHVALCAVERGWAVVTGTPEFYRGVVGVEVEETA